MKFVLILKKREIKKKIAHYLPKENLLLSNNIIYTL